MQTSDHDLAESARRSAIEVVRLRAAVDANPVKKAARGWDLKMLHSHEKKVRMYAEELIWRAQCRAGEV